MAYPGLAHEEHKYLGKEYCTGYTDVYGKWNTGFYCPQYGSKTAVFCCGTAVFKYCCTNQEPVDLSSSNGGVLLDGDDPNFDHPHGSGVSSAVFVRVPIVFGVVCGITAVLILLLVAGCYFCSCCFAYKKRRNDMISDPRHHHLHMNHQHQLPPFGNPGQGGATLLNLYSPGTTTTTGPLTTRSSLVTTPLDLDWTSSIASSYQSQQQLYAPLQYPPPPGSSPGLSPAAAAIAAALSQRSSHSPAGSSLLYGGSGTPSMISGSLPASSQGTGRLPSSQAYQGYLNSSTSTLSSVPPPSISVPRGNNPAVGQPSLHRGTLPQQMSTTASIVNSYLASLQQAQLQTHAPPEQQPPPPVIQVDRTRHPSPPPSYFQSVSSASSYPGNRNSTGNNRNASMNSSSNRTGRMATIQSILGGSNSGGNSYSGFNWNNEEDLLIADFLLRHENTLRRSLGMSNNSSSNASANNRTNNSTTNNNRSTHRGNPMLSQRELIELLLRLTCNTNSSTSSITRSDSGVGSDTNSTTSSVTTTRSTSSSSGKLPTTHAAAPTTTPNNKSVTICEVDEDNDTGQDVTSDSATVSTPNANVNHPVSGRIKASLDLALSRMSVVENDSGVPSSTCSTAGSEGAECVIGSIKMISRDLSEDAIKLNKQHAVDDDSSCVGGSDDGNLTKKFQQQLAASTIHPETNCASDGDGIGGGSDGEIMIIESSHHPSSPPPISRDHHHNCNSDHGGKDINNGVGFENPTMPHTTTSPATVQEV